MKEAKIIALTCTHAALKRKDLVDIAFKVGRRHISVTSNLSSYQLSVLLLRF